MDGVRTIHCSICDRSMTGEEVSWNEDLGTYDPCSVCMFVILDAAYGKAQYTNEDTVTELDTAGEEPLLDEEFDHDPRERTTSAQSQGFQHTFAFMYHQSSDAEDLYD